MREHFDEIGHGLYFLFTFLVPGTFLLHVWPYLSHPHFFVIFSWYAEQLGGSVGCFLFYDVAHVPHDAIIIIVF
jgi:hypothetical protein